MAVARGSITITDLTDGKSVAGFLVTSQGTVQLNANDSGYVPDYTSTPNIITPTLSISGEDDRQYFQSAPTWIVGGTTLTASTDTYTLGTSANNYALTINKNITSSTLIIRCEGVYTENSVDTDVSMETTLTKVDNSGSGLKVLVSASTTVLDASTTSTTATATLYNGVNVVISGVSYQWQEYEEGAWGNVTGGTSGTLTITRDMVETKSQFRCNCTYSGETVSGIIMIDDIADEYKISFLGADKLKTSSPTTEITAVLYADGVEVSTFSVDWTMFDEDGVEVEDWSSTSNPLTVTRDMFENKASFLAEANI